MRNEVIKIAYEYGVNSDISDISLVKISNDLGISRRNIYRFFDNKYDLMFEVYKMIVLELADEVAELNKSNVGKTGYAQTEEAMNNMIKVFLNNSNKLKYVTKFDAINTEDKDLIQRNIELYRSCDFTYTYLELGVKDGSIKQSIDAYSLSCVILETVIGVVSRFNDIKKSGSKMFMSESDIYNITAILSLYLATEEL